MISFSFVPGIVNNSRVNFGPYYYFKIINFISLINFNQLYFIGNKPMFDLQMYNEYFTHHNDNRYLWNGDMHLES